MTKRETLDAANKGEGCLGKAADDEPVFVLRGQDVLAANTLWTWLQQARVHGVHADKIFKAEDDFQAFLDWRKHNGTKLPD